MLLRRFGNDDLRRADIEQCRAPHANALAGVGRPGDDVFAVADGSDLARQRAGDRVHAQLRERHLVAHRQRDGGAYTRLDHRGDGFGVAHGPDSDVGQALLQRFVQDMHVIARAAGHAVVAVVEQQHGAVARFGGQFGGACDRFGQRFRAVDEAFAVGPDGVGNALGGNIGGLCIAIADHHDG